LDDVTGNCNALHDMTVNFNALDDMTINANALNDVPGNILQALPPARVIFINLSHLERLVGVVVGVHGNLRMRPGIKWRLSWLIPFPGSSNPPESARI
jgi:hypothetical protein